MKHISKNRNTGHAFVYYAINNHQYQITDKKACQSLIETAKDKELTVLTSAIIDEEEKEDIFGDLEI